MANSSENSLNAPHHNPDFNPTYIYMSEMKVHRNPSLDSREYRNFVTYNKQMSLQLFEIYDHELGLEATISRRT